MDWSINSFYIFGRGIFVSLIQSQMSDSQGSEMKKIIISLNNVSIFPSYISKFQKLFE